MVCGFEKIAEYPAIQSSCDCAGSRLRASPDQNDPYLFIETIPLSETRNFVQRVLTNYWVYRARIGQPDTSLTAAMTGGWPVYRGLDRGEQRAEKKN